MDDVWHCEEWETINKSLPDNNLGSRIVTTCRFKSIITEMWRNDFDALVYVVEDPTFFDYSAIIGEDFDHLHHIMRMCRGTPLALVCMISALAKERERQQQEEGLCVLNTPGLQDRVEEQLMRNGIQNTPGFEPLVESLELGYNDLPHHMLKTCLLYCSIYPEDHIFRRNDLVRRWIAEGFVCKEEAAEDYFDELVTRGLLEEHGSSFFDYYYEVHPMMQNYLRGKVREDNFITCTSDGIPSSLVSRLCIDCWPSTSSEAVDPLSGIDWHHIRSLVVFGDGKRVPYKHLKHLRVLDVQRLKPLESRYNSVVLEKQHLKDICGLLRLRHLLLSGGLLEAVDRIKVGPEWDGITEIPTEIARLQYLETLDVRGTGITRLPAEIADLKQLKTLSLSWNSGLAELPREIGKLHQLKTLNLTSTEITELPCEIWNLQLLEALYLSLTLIRILHRNVGKLQNLKTLDLGSVSVMKVPREIGGLKKLKNVNVSFSTLPFEAAQLSNLERLPKCVRRAWKNSDLVSSLAGEILSFEETQGYGGGDGGLIVGTKHVHIPQWIKEHFNNISSLDIRICKLEEQDLKILREMPNLIGLTIRFEAVPRKPIVISSGGFAMLSYLTVDSRVPRIAFQEGAMPRLEWLTFEFQFYGGPLNTDPVGIKHLVSLKKVFFQRKGWYRADSPCISATIDVMRKEVMEHPNEIKLYVPGEYRDIFAENSIITQSSQDRDEACSSSGAQEIQEICGDGSEACSSSGAQEIEEIQA